MALLRVLVGLRRNNRVTVKTLVKWAFPEEITSFGSSPSIATDKQGHVHIVYINDWGTGWSGYLAYANNKTGTWVRDRELTESGDIYYKSMAVDSEGYIHIIYATGSSGDKSIMYINNIAGEWSNPSLIKEHTGDCASLKLHLDSQRWI